MRKDKKFKDRINILEYDYKIVSYHCDDYYTPDVVFLDEKKRNMIIAESSSTGDRKAHVGELTQFITYTREHVVDKRVYTFILFLCGENENSPQAQKEKERLSYYYNKLVVDKDKQSIKAVYVIDQKNIDISKIDVNRMEEYGAYKIS